MKKFALPALCLLSAGLAIGLICSSLLASDLRVENQSLRKQLEAFTAQSLAPQRAETVVTPTSEPPDSELIRLRGEVVTLRHEKNELERVRKENENLRITQTQERERARAEVAAAQAQRPAPQPVGKLPRDAWTFAGYENPEAALQSLLWAGAAGNSETLLASFTPEQLKRMQTEDGANRSEQEVLDRMAKQISKIKGFQILTVDSRSADEAVVTMFLEGLEGSEQTQRMKMQRVNNAWRLAGPDRANKE